MLDARVLCLFALGCGAAAPLETTPPRAPEPVIALQPFDAGAPAAAQAPDAGAPPVVSEVLDPRCVGAELDLDAILAGKLCRLEHRPPRSSIAAALEFEATSVAPVAPGATARIELTLTNTTDAPQQLTLEYGCNALETSATYPGTQVRADLIENERCGFGRGCGVTTMRVELPAGGRMRASTTFVARATRVTDACKQVSAGAMKRGSYTLHVVAPTLDGAQAERTVTADLAIR